VATSTERVRRMRERQRASLEPAPGEVPRDPSELIAPFVEETLAALELGDQDAAAAQLARRYAAAIDCAADSSAALRAFGPPLTRLLSELQATPASRKTASKPPGLKAVNPVRDLRTAHAAFMSGKRS
jgi:hypothetical protein